MSDWQPAGSSAYDTAYADGDFRLEHDDHGSPAFFSTTPYRPIAVRSAKHCIGNDGTCKGFKSQGTDLCSGHNKAAAKLLLASSVI